MFGLGMQELLLIFGIVILLFGAKRIPEIGASLGSGIKNFKKSFKASEEESDTAKKILDGHKNKE